MDGKELLALDFVGAKSAGLGKIPFLMWFAKQYSAKQGDVSGRVKEIQSRFSSWKPKYNELLNRVRQATWNVSPEKVYSSYANLPENLGFSLSDFDFFYNGYILFRISEAPEAVKFSAEYGKLVYLDDCHSVVPEDFVDASTDTILYLPIFEFHDSYAQIMAFLPDEVNGKVFELFLTSVDEKAFLDGLSFIPAEDFVQTCEDFLSSLDWYTELFDALGDFILDISSTFEKGFEEYLRAAEPPAEPADPISVPQEVGKGYGGLQGTPAGTSSPQGPGYSGPSGGLMNPQIGSTPEVAPPSSPTFFVEKRG